MKRFLATLIIVLLPGIASADGFDIGWVAYKKGDYETAIEVWRALANSGDAQSQTALGSLYYLGLGVPHDHAEARRLFSLAAEHGLGSALFNLGLYYTNPDYDQNFVEAYKWFSLSAERGMVEGDWRLDRLVGKMTADQIAEAQRMAREWQGAHPK